MSAEAAAEPLAHQPRSLSLGESKLLREPRKREALERTVSELLQRRIEQHAARAGPASGRDEQFRLRRETEGQQLERQAGARQRGNGIPDRGVGELSQAARGSPSRVASGAQGGGPRLR